MTAPSPADSVAREVLGAVNSRDVLMRVSLLCERFLGARVTTRLFHRVSVGSVHGVRLSDGREVVVKLHRAFAPFRYLKALNELQAHVADAGFPAPKPLAPPARLPNGSATFEASLARGDPPDPDRPEHLALMASGLAWLVELCEPFASRAEFEPWLARRRDGLWPIPHDARFDFVATAQGAAWIDTLARRARALLDADPGRRVIGHHDWRREHLRVRQGRLCAVYDWDSVGRFAEPVLVAGAARTFTVDWSRVGQRQYPTLEQMHEFLDAYETARGRPFSRDERAHFRAALVYGAAYTARCEHSDDRTNFGRGPLAPPPDFVPTESMRAFLQEHGETLLAGED
ncbi:phosphotransferase [Deinococcus yavapaiensis]|uniref:Aminoglycoside phosphotransferase (APT) family kinase protein n=1 Tax=Deinococcus yavapaiensis KR-236 TaxID=694435 RepID=A0A318SAV7_9DEIO|nr:phosphotransferase [Deinococcus yavapaiensis]PYE55702.1 aminoglycoside phosphotransferase (APT) family kinase protein [Deinococcus yavapaiensis KR-236]